MKKVNFIILALVGVAAVACSTKTNDLDKLKQKKNKLKTELSELDAEIAELDTVKERVYPLVEFGKANVGSFVHKISVQGEIETDEDALINAETSGIIERIHVKEGQKVSKGQTLITLDASILSSSISEIQTQLSFAEYMLDKQKQLMDRGLGSEFDLKEAQNQVESLKSKLNTLSTQRKQATVKAPFSGIVDRIFPKVGEIASPQSQLLRLVNNDKIRITANISESHLTAVNIGTPIEVFVPVLRDTIDSKITIKGNYIEPTNRTFRIQAHVKNNEKLLPNMVSELRITDMTLDSAMVVPTTSILKTQQNRNYIFVAKRGENNSYSVQRVYVNLISSFDGKSAIEVVDGKVENGDIVVSRGARGITEKDLVKEKI